MISIASQVMKRGIMTHASILVGTLQCRIHIETEIGKKNARFLRVCHLRNDLKAAKPEMKLRWKNSEN
jgi:hypothetical protein